MRPLIALLGVLLCTHWSATASEAQDADAEIQAQFTKLANEAVKDLPIMRVTFRQYFRIEHRKVTRADTWEMCKYTYTRILDKGGISDYYLSLPPREKEETIRRSPLPSDGGPIEHRTSDFYDIKQGTLAAVENRLSTVFKPMGFELETGSYLDLFQSMSVHPELETVKNPVRYDCTWEPMYDAGAAVLILDLRATLSLSSLGIDYLKSRRASHFAWKSLTMHSPIEELATSIQYSLRGIEMLPKHRRMLQGFQSATDRLVAALAEQNQKRARAEKYLAPTHRSFSAAAGLLISYARALNEPFEELTKLASAKNGLNPINVDHVDAIRHVLRCLEEAYGLDSDVHVHVLADNARVMADLIASQVNPVARPEELERVVKPLLQDLSRVIATSETQGDVSAVADLRKLLATWSSPQVQGFIQNTLSVSDNGHTSMATNLMMLIERMAKHAGVR